MLPRVPARARRGAMSVLAGHCTGDSVIRFHRQSGTQPGGCRQTGLTSFRQGGPADLPGVRTACVETGSPVGGFKRRGHVALQDDPLFFVSRVGDRDGRDQGARIRDAEAPCRGLAKPQSPQCVRDTLPQSCPRRASPRPGRGQ